MRLEEYLAHLEVSLADVATIHTTPPSGRPDGPGLSVEVVPNETDAARLNIHVENQTHVDIDLGEKSHLEIVASSTGEILDTLRYVVDAIVTGNFEETVWRKDGQMVKALGVIGSGRDALKIHSSDLKRVLTLRKSEKRHRRFAPYRGK